jgi:hypothetical protein
MLEWFFTRINSAKFNLPKVFLFTGPTNTTLSRKHYKERAVNKTVRHY